MANDLTLDSQEIAPYDPGMSPLTPLSPAPWADTGVDLLREEQPRQSGPTIFGAALPTGATPQHIQAVLGEIGGVYLSDFTKLGYPPALIQSAITFFMDNATKPAQQVQRHNTFKLPNELAGDWLAELFGNYLQGLGGKQQQKQQFLDASLAWINKLNNRLNSQQLGTQPAPRMATPSSNSGHPDDLSNDEYNRLYDYNQKMAPRTEGILRDKWGDSYEANRSMTDAYLQGLSAVERQHFDKFLNNGLHALNDPTVILGLYGQAIGINNIPSSGPALQDDISACQTLMKSNPKQWRADERLQARYRYMLGLQRNARRGN